MSKLSRWEKVAGWSALGLIIAMFFPWYVAKNKATSLEDLESGTAATAWQAFGFIDLILFALAAGVIYLLWAKTKDREPKLPAPRNLVLLAGGALATLLILFRIVSPPDLGISEGALEASNSEITPVFAWFALAPAALIGFAGWRLMQESGQSLSEELSGLTSRVSSGSSRAPAAKPAADKAPKREPSGSRPGASAGGTVAGLQRRYLPEPLHGNRGLVFSALGLILVAVLSIGTWEAVGGEDTSDASGGDESSLACEETTETVVDESGVGDSGSFFPPDPDDPSQAPTETTSVECSGNLPDELEDGSFDNCGNGVYAGPGTSCGFSNQVASEYRATGESEITADSVNAGEIALQCEEQEESAVRCESDGGSSIWVLG